MKEGFWGYFLIALGIIIIVGMMLVYNYTSANESDYYLLKEATEAAMIDSVDYGIYSRDGDLYINKEKFVENFTRRFAQITNIDRNYKLEFFEIYERPPKVSVRVTTSTGEHTVNHDTADIPVVNKLDGILEMKE